ncbi:sugar transferase [Calothrix sp. NIES-2100]|uniref:sugar transferase n=1 Tax=Calothrix sp. NIES-2100 TaxID=1954172 RepID=UPI000B60359A|nr:sugar transferase [Calothrix sp. NIES-2100]
MTNIPLSEASLDLRAPEFFRVRKGLWWLRLITLALVDYALLFLALVFSKDHAYFVNSSGNEARYYLAIFITIFIQIGALYSQGLYQQGKNRHEYLNIIKTLIFAHGLILLMEFVNQTALVDVSPYKLTLSWLLSVLFVCAGRFGINITLEYLRNKKILGVQPVFIICDPDNSQQLINLIKKEKHYTIGGYATAKSLDRYHRQETLAKLHQLGVTEVFISWDAIKNRMFLCWLFQSAGITAHIVPMELKPIYREIEFNQIGGMTCISFDCPIITGKDFWIKRSFDFVFAALFLALTAPIYIAIALAIKLDSPGPVFYRQTRIGLRGQPFQVWKFRTMRADAETLQKELEALNEIKDGIIFKIKDDPRITRIGKFLRRYSLDELPQLFNVLTGEMSLVGPRPLPTRDVDKFSERHFIRHEVLPGVTGLWQVSGRSDILDFEQVIKLDLNYIENWSLRLDFEILVKTVKVVLKKEGAY